MRGRVTGFLGMWLDDYAGDEVCLNAYYLVAPEGEPRLQPQPEEVAELGWFAPDELPLEEMAFPDHTRDGARGLAGAGAGVRRALALALLCLLAAAPAGARAAAPPGRAGRWITDAQGRVLILHGLNMVYKRPPYAPDAIGFGADDARFLAADGFNAVRLGVIYAAVEPPPGVYDDAYLADRRTVDDARAARDRLAAGLPPGPVQRALPGRGLPGLGGAGRRAARAAAARLPRQLPGRCRRSSTPSTTSGRTRRAGRRRPGRTATRRVAHVARASRADPTCSATTC